MRRLLFPFFFALLTIFGWAQTPVTTTLGSTNYVSKFVNASGEIKNSMIFDTSTPMTVGNIGIGTTAPAATLHVVSSSTPAGFIDVYSNTLNAVTFVTRAARGTLGSPSAVQTDDIIGGFTARGLGDHWFFRWPRVTDYSRQRAMDGRSAEHLYSVQYGAAGAGLPDGADAHRQCR